MAENTTRDAARNITIQHEGFTSLRIFVLCIFFNTFVVGLIENGLVIFLTGCRMKKTVNSIWFLNLAIADFIFLLSSVGVALLVILSVQGKQNYSEFVIHTVLLILALNRFTSIFFLVVISLDRCLCAWMVVWAKNKRTLLKARIICILVWVSSISCSFTFFEDKTSQITYEFIVGFLIPFLIIVTSYIAIGVRIKRLKMGKQLKSYRVIITIILAFFICWFPYYVCYFYFITTEENNWSASDQDVFNIAAIVSIYLVYLNSCLNPVLYVFMCDEYKKKLKQSLLLVLETAFHEDHLDFKA